MDVIPGRPLPARRPNAELAGNRFPLRAFRLYTGGPSKHNGAKASITGGGAKAFKVGDGRGDGVQSR